MKTLLEKILKNRHSLMFSILYAEIYKKPTGFQSVETMLEHIKESAQLDNELVEEFKEKFPKENLTYNLIKYGALKSHANSLMSVHFNK